MDPLLLPWRWPGRSMPATIAADTDEERVGSVTFLFLRRMRAPLLVLIATYAVAVTGLVLIPGVDPDGRPWRFSFFHAFYFISYTGASIGFGEIPHPFTPAQRLWVTACIYLTVVGWVYAIGSLLALARDPALKRALSEQRFARRVRRLSGPFYVVCGYEETGSQLVQGMCRRGLQPVVVDTDADRLSRLDLEDLGFDVPWIGVDAWHLRVLRVAGLDHPGCRALIATSTDESAVRHVALAAKLLSPHLRVVARAETAETAAELEAAGAEHLIDPFATFGEHLAMTLRAPSLHMLFEYLVRLPGQKLPAKIVPPSGRWIVCGHGRFGRAAARALEATGSTVTVIERDPGNAPPGALVGRASDPALLRQAGIEGAAAIIAGTSNDALNLTIALTARRLAPSIYLVARQNRRADAPLFAAAGIDLLAVPSRIIVWRMLAELTQPLVNRFLEIAESRGEPWSREVLATLDQACAGRTPDTWETRIDATGAPAVHEALAAGRTVPLDTLLREPDDRSRRLPALPLLLARGSGELLLPTLDLPLAANDRVLFAARAGAAARMGWVLGHNNAFEYALDGVEHPDGYVWRWASRVGRRPSASSA